MGLIVEVACFVTGDLVLRVLTVGRVKSVADYRSWTARELMFEARTWLGLATWLVILGTIGRIFDI